MIKTFILGTVQDRLNDLKLLLNSIAKYYPSWNISMCCQGYTKSDEVELENHLKSIGLYEKTLIDYRENLIGAHSSKVIALNQIDADIYCSIDDDMELTERTDYDTIVQKLIVDKSSGIITSNWAKTFAMYEKKEQIFEFKKQILVYTGGGLLFRKDLKSIFVNIIPNKEYLFDDCLWALYSYINGYDNYRYLGSLSIHKICTKGGRRTWISKTNSRKELPPVELLKTRKGKSKSGYNEYLICTEKDLTNFSKELHKDNKK